MKETLEQVFLCVKILGLISKTLKILAILPILLLYVFRSFGLFTFCHHTTRFSSLGTSVLLSYQPQSPRGSLRKRYSSKFHKIHSKIHVSESFLKVMSTKFLLVCFIYLKRELVKQGNVLFILLQKFFSFLR